MQKQVVKSSLDIFILAAVALERGKWSKIQILNQKL